jgi:peptidoglycan/LPS O-acetylase OafA/YrhL
MIGMEMVESNLEGVLGVMIPIVAIVGGLSLGFAGFYMRYRERMEMINRGMDVSKMEFPKRRRSPLRSALTFLGVGVGLLVAYVLCHTIIAENPGENVVIYVGCAFLFVGLGRFLTYTIESKNQNNTGGVQ